ncbi:hypothetical protein KH172YL63_11130 [Bacillus sp. KH172YL63]|nr:hypothetical protein KH172YL63_11130 [Bacillus sp. KH172YL63]
MMFMGGPPFLIKDVGVGDVVGISHELMGSRVLKGMLGNGATIFRQRDHIFQRRIIFQDSRSYMDESRSYFQKADHNGLKPAHIKS